MLALHLQFQLSAGKIIHIGAIPSSKEGIQTTLVGNTPADKGLGVLIEKWITGYINRKPIEEELPLEWPALPVFSASILKRLQRIPLGETVSYGEIAEEMESPRGARAVGNACGRNPFLLVIPCHRVLGAHGNLGGFTAGLLIKKQLLVHEAGGLGKDVNIFK